MARKTHRFPIGVYATLLGALCWLAVPQLTRGVERGLMGVACLPLRAYASLLGSPRAMDADAADRQLVLELQQRQEAVAADVSEDIDRRPVFCRVLEWRNTGGGGLPAELLLDRSYRQLAGCEPFLTYRDHLLGFLAEPGLGPALDDDLDDRARLLLLNHPASPGVPAALQMDDDHVLRCFVEPAGSVDRWPLRCGLWEDPYVASQLARSGGELRSLQLTGGGGVPAGLRIGHAEVWGYQLRSERVPIGVYAQPGLDPRTISTVVAWRAQGPPEGLREPPATREPVTLLWVPGPAGARSFANGRWPLVFPDDAALVRGVRLLGTARGLGPGQALAQSFADTRRAWSFVLLPPTGEPVELRGRVAGREGTDVWVRLLDGNGQLGHLFTGVNGLHSPAGLLVGEVLRVSDGAGMILVERSATQLSAEQVGGQSIFVFPEEGL